MSKSKPMVVATEEEVVPILRIGNVRIYANQDCTYIRFQSDLDVCVDGSGDDHGDPYYQSETAYFNDGKFLNADKDQYIVIPPQIRSDIAPVVMGCQARLTRVSTGKTEPAVTGEIGPSDKTGEAAICLAQKMNAQVTANSGDSKHDYLYELWPGTPAIVHGKKYKLEPA